MALLSGFEIGERVRDDKGLAMVWSGLFNQIETTRSRMVKTKPFLHQNALLSSFGMFWDSCEIGVRWISCVASRSQTHLPASMEGV